DLTAMKAELQSEDSSLATLESEIRTDIASASEQVVADNSESESNDSATEDNSSSTSSNTDTNSDSGSSSSSSNASSNAGSNSNTAPTATASTSNSSNSRSSNNSSAEDRCNSSESKNNRSNHNNSAKTEKPSKKKPRSSKPAPKPSGNIHTVRNAGNKYIGNSSYEWGGGRTASDIANGRFDCSGFVSWAFSEAGISVP